MRISDWSSDVCSSDLTQPSHNTTERGPAMPPEPVTPKQMPFDKYRPFLPLVLADRTWHDARIEKAPLWCSVGLRDGNQALIDPMDPARESRKFDTPGQMGFTALVVRSVGNTSEVQSLMRKSNAVYSVTTNIIN